MKPPQEKRAKLRSHLSGHDVFCQEICCRREQQAVAIMSTRECDIIPAGYRSKDWTGIRRDR